MNAYTVRCRDCRFVRPAEDADAADKLVQDHWARRGNESHEVVAVPRAPGESK